MPGSVCSSEHVCKPNTKSPCISICWAWQHPLKVSLFTTNHTDQGDKIRARNRWQTQSLGGREVNKEWGKVVRHQYKQRNTKDLLGQRRLNKLLDSTEHMLSSCSCFTLGATVPYIYASATLQEPRGGKKGFGIEAKQGSTGYPPISVMHRNSSHNPRDSNKGV